MKKHFLPFILGLLTVSAAILLFYAVGGNKLDTSRLASDILETTALQTMLNTEPGYGLENVDLAVSGVRLNQGANGSEQWALTAQYATLRQNLGLLDINAPQISYVMPGTDNNSAERLLASSRTGLVDNYQNRLVMRGDVLANYGLDTVRAPMAVYYNQRRMLEFSGGVVLASPQLSGRAETVIWDLNNNVLHAANGVSMTWSTPSEPDSAAVTSPF